jgi:hypothetical protein
VDFFDGGNKIGTGTLAGNGQATVITSAATSTAGAHAITATYTTGDTNFNQSPKSAAVTETVAGAATTTSVASSNNGASFGQSVNFTATVSDVTAGSTAHPTGAVQFQIDGVNFDQQSLGSRLRALSDCNLHQCRQ